MTDRTTKFTTRYAAEINSVARFCPTGAQLCSVGGTSLAICGLLSNGLRVEVTNALMDHHGDSEAFFTALHDPDGDQVAWLDDGTLVNQLLTADALSTANAHMLRQHRAAHGGRLMQLSALAHTTAIDPTGKTIDITDLGAVHRISISDGQPDSRPTSLELTNEQLGQFAEMIFRRPNRWNR
ncbi:hypothetical protein ACFWPX_30070 [Nocardia sp. NPDC058518]|uniref:hypothetical protein n=1 Tax=Nocardia sp. NPDC058518 TaxID=3346534 RepID=UPI003657A886